MSGELELLRRDLVPTKLDNLAAGTTDEVYWDNGNGATFDAADALDLEGGATVATPMFVHVSSDVGLWLYFNNSIIEYGDSGEELGAFYPTGQTHRLCCYGFQYLHYLGNAVGSIWATVKGD